MSRFQGHIVVDQKGYSWDETDVSLEDGHDAYTTGMYIKWNSEWDLRQQYNEHGEVNYDFTYDPFVTEPALFRVFARLDPTADDVLAFANRYGDFSSLGDVMEGVDWTLWDWEDAIGRVRGYIERADEFIAYQHRRPGAKKLTTEMVDLLNELFSYAEVHLSAVLLNGNIDLKMDVYSLPYVFYLQIAEAIADLKQYRNCELCDKPFELSPQVNRSDRLFCSDNCRVKAYQRRKKKVIDLRKSVTVNGPPALRGVLRGCDGGGWWRLGVLGRARRGCVRDESWPRGQAGASG